MNKKGPHNLGSEAKPRRGGTAPRGRDAIMARRKLPSKALRSQKMREEARTSGALRMRDHAPSGSTSGVVIGVTGPSGGISSNPVDQLAYRVRQAFKPLVIAPAVVTGPDGRVLRTITYGPNGERRVTYPTP